MNNILSEKEYQRYIIDQLVKPECGYVEAPAAEFDRLFAMNRKALFAFLEATQPEKLQALRKIYKEKTEDTLVAFINQQETRANGSRLDVLKHGVELANIHLDLMYTKPATTFNKELNALYHKNIFTVSEEVWASDDERIDLVIFLNGLAIITFELKCNAAGQSYQDAIYQYRMQRNPKDRLFLWKAGSLVNFAMDLEQVYMCTRLSGSSTFFLPFNMGCGEGIQVGAGNPLLKDEYSVHYMWDDILQKDSLLEILGKFMFIEVSEKEDANGKVKKNETVIFPRYHQLDVLRKVLADVKENGSSLNYLLQHSAGSGKTNEIAWLAHRLASLHSADNKIIFDNIIICTDRVVVDRQLQQAVLGIEHKEGLIRVMDDQCNSTDLANALGGNTKIVATTIQKFPYIVDSVKGLKNKHFAVIIDEAHSSTSGKNMAAITKSLGSGEVETDVDVEDIITDEIQRNGKQPNVSMFAFTATPKPTTLQLFGRVNEQGQYEAFHIYSMKQAIEEGFILDVLQNYITYDTFFRLNKEIEDDPEMKTNDAKRQIARFVQLHETNISQRIEVIIEHFRQNVMQELNGQAKAMVITESRAGAVKYR
ncbi:DEAD/DEAH box helicase family protein [Phascolarctobacterium succinatutens]